MTLEGEMHRHVQYMFYNPSINRMQFTNYASVVAYPSTLIDIAYQHEVFYRKYELH